MPLTLPRRIRKIFNDSDSSGAEGKKAGLAVSRPVLGALLIFAAAVAAWAFFMGYMVGQGHNPNARIQEMTGLSLPTPRAEKSSPEEPPQNPAEPSPASAPQPAPPAAESARAPETPFRTPKGRGLDAWGGSPKPPKAAAAPAAKKPARTDKEELFDYSFQIAAFKNPSDAESLQKRLAGAGIRAKAQKSGKVHLLITNIRGSSQAVENLHKKLASMKLGRPLQLSKQPVQPKAQRKK